MKVKIEAFNLPAPLKQKQWPSKGFTDKKCKLPSPHTDYNNEENEDIPLHFLIK